MLTSKPMLLRLSNNARTHVRCSKKKSTEMPPVAFLKGPSNIDLTYDFTPFEGILKSVK